MEWDNKHHNIEAIVDKPIQFEYIHSGDPMSGVKIKLSCGSCTKAKYVPSRRAIVVLYSLKTWPKQNKTDRVFSRLKITVKHSKGTEYLTFNVSVKKS